MNIAGVLQEQAGRFGDRDAIVERQRSITFRELDRAAASAAGDLARAGVRPGMRALVFSPMSIALYTTMIALFRLRVTAVFVDPSAGRERLNRCVARVRPDAFVAVPRAHWLRLTSPAIRAIPIKAAIGGGVPGAAAIARRVSDAADNFAAYIMLQFGKDVALRTVRGTHLFFGAIAIFGSDASAADVRSSAAQRNFNTICIAYGGDPATFNDIVDVDDRFTPLPRARRGVCRQEYEAVRKSFDRYIRRHVDEAKLAKVRSMDWLRPDDGR